VRGIPSVVGRWDAVGIALANGTGAAQLLRMMKAMESFIIIG
jgi:hypothetical protein